MKNILFVFASLVPLCARADLPLSLEGVMTDKGKLKLDASVTYINSESSRSELAAPVYIQTGAASFIPVPTEIQENGSNSDMLVGTLGLRYGLTGNTDIYGSGSYLWRENRQFNGESGFLESTVYEKSQGKASSGKSWLIGATTYKAIDPVVLSPTAAYRLNGSKTLSSNTKYKAGNYWMLNPSILFAANDRISLTGGIQWLGKQPDRIDGKKETARNTSTYAHFGAGFGFSKATALNASVRFNISGQTSSELKLGIQHTF